MALDSDPSKFEKEKSRVNHHQLHDIAEQETPKPRYEDNISMIRRIMNYIGELAYYSGIR
jgi:hypothetical protein